MDQPTPLQELLARALVEVNEKSLRSIVTEAIEARIADYDCKRILNAAVDPLVREIIKHLLETPEVQSVLRSRVNSELLRLASTATLTWR